MAAWHTLPGEVPELLHIVPVALCLYPFHRGLRVNSFPEVCSIPGAHHSNPYRETHSPALTLGCVLWLQVGLGLKNASTCPYRQGGIPRIA